jgi:hypothetical protein
MEVLIIQIFLLNGEMLQMVISDRGCAYFGGNNGAINRNPN